MNKILNVSLFVAFSNAIGRRLQDTPPDSGDSVEPPAEVPFVETGGFIAIIVVAAVLVTCSFCCLGCTISNNKWRDERKKEFESLSEIAKTSKGEIEYRKWGEAPYMVMLPGTPGFCHSTFASEHYGFGLITVSRPGYGRTPLTDELKKSTAQADLIAALMEHLGIEKYPVMVASGGGVIGLRLAIQYPQNVQCLLMQCATTGKLTHAFYQDIARGDGKMVMCHPGLARVGAYYCRTDGKEIMVEDLKTANKVEPGCMSDETIQKRLDVVMKFELTQAVLDDMAGFFALVPCYPSCYDSMLVDLDYYKDDIPFDQVKVPTHIMHGDRDHDIPYSQAEQAHKGIEGSILITVPLGTHSLQIHENWPKYIGQQIAFAKKHCGMEFDQAILDEKL